MEGRSLSCEDVRLAVAGGDFQIGIVIPEGATGTAEKMAERLVRESFPDSNFISNAGEEMEGLTRITVFVDPAIRDSYRITVLSSLRQLVYSKRGYRKG